MIDHPTKVSPHCRVHWSRYQVFLSTALIIAVACPYSAAFASSFANGLHSKAPASQLLTKKNNPKRYKTQPISKSSYSCLSAQPVNNEHIGDQATQNDSLTVNTNDHGLSEIENLSNMTTFRGGGVTVGRSQPPPQPTLRQYFKFAIPCLGLWVASPLLSLVDTSFVGLSAGKAASAQQLAALGPATTL